MTAVSGIQPVGDVVHVMRFSIRSILIVTGSVVSVCAMFAVIPLESEYIALAVFLAAFGAAAASIGYDLNPRFRSAVLGTVIGLVTGFAVYLWLSQPVIRE